MRGTLFNHLAAPMVDGPRGLTTLLVSSYSQNTISGELARTPVLICFPRKETWMKAAASRIGEWIECLVRGGLWLCVGMCS